MLREVGADDEPFLWEMLAAAVYVTPAWTVEQVRATPEVARYLEGWGRPGGGGVVAGEGDADDPDAERLGAAWYRIYSADEPGYGFVDDTTPELTVAIRPEARGEGLGHELLLALLHRAHRDGHERLSLSTDAANAVARAVYTDCGFVPAGPPTSDGTLVLVGRTRATPPGPRPEITALAPGAIDQELLDRSIFGEVVAGRDELHHVTGLPGFVAELDGEAVGLATWRLTGDEVEVVGIETWVDGRGVGTALLGAVREVAAGLGCHRVWLTTTNDNTRALRFYQRRGFELVALHRDGASRARDLKPTIPWIGDDGIPIRHELELEYRLGHP